MMTQSEKKLLLLEALNKIGITNEYTDVTQIFIENDINITNTEAREIAKSLEEEGKIKYLGTHQAGMGRITTDGVAFLEEKENSHGTFDSDNFTEEEKKKLIAALDELSERLTKIELGQQVIYDDVLKEIEELKDLMNTLNKKNWFQLFKGKLVDLGLGQLSEQTISMIGDITKSLPG